MRHKGLALALDAVVFAYCIDDPIETDMGDMTNLVSSPLQLVNLFRLRAYRRARDGDWYAEDSPVFKRLDEAFTDLASLARTTPIALAVMPLTEATARKQPHREPVLSLCARHGVPCSTCSPALAARLPSVRRPAQRQRTLQPGGARRDRGVPRGRAAGDDRERAMAARACASAASGSSIASNRLPIRASSAIACCSSARPSSLSPAPTRTQPRCSLPNARYH